MNWNKFALILLNKKTMCIIEQAASFAWNVWYKLSYFFIILVPTVQHIMLETEQKMFTWYQH